MKRLVYFVALIAIIAMATPTQLFAQTSGIQITVLGQLTAGTLSGGNTPLCWNGAIGLITGTAPTGGQGNYTYQWQSSLDNITWSIVPGATGLNYDPGNGTVNKYFRRVDTDGCGTVTSNVIFITVYGQFLVGVTTGGTTPICTGGNGGTLTSTASTGGAPGTTYQWQSSIDNITFNDILGETTLTYIVGSPAQTTYYRIAYINPSCGTIYGNVTTITVYAVFAAGTVTGGSTPICYNTNAGILTSTAPIGGAPGTTLQWESSTDGITYTNMLGQTTLTTTLGILSQTMWYRLRYTNTCGVVYSNVTNIVVYTQFVAGTISLVGATPICNNTDPGSFTGTASIGGAPGTTYQWQFTIDGGLNWNNVLGATLQNYDPANLTQTTGFRRQDVNSCSTLYTNIITITVYSVFNPGIIGVAQSICYGNTPTALGFITVPTGGDGIFTYQWEQSPTGLVGSWTIIPGATSNTYQPPSLTSGIWYHVIVTNVCGSSPALP